MRYSKREIRIMVWAGIVAGLFFCFGLAMADPYKPIDTKSYLESLPIPGTTASCCGPADAYLVKRLERCGPDDIQIAEAEFAECAFVAILGKQPTEWLKYQAVHFPEGHRVVVTKGRLRKRPIPNPLGFPVVFTNGSMGKRAICFEPLAGG